MFCVIQEINTKKPDKNGYPKEIISEVTESSFLGRYFWHYYSSERFERPIKKAYRISIHESYRENGRVKKHQYPICTVNYYDLATDSFTLYDWGDSKIRAAAEALKVSEDIIYDLIEKKLQPIWDRVIAEFQQTEEYQVHQEHDRITTVYAAAKVKFNQMYGTSGGEYDQCYDVFGILQNPQRLKEIQEAAKAAREYEYRSQQESRSYYEKYYSNYGSSQGSSYSNSNCSNYSEEDKVLLKKFYRTLSKAFHPDSNPDKDTSTEMKMLNKMKQEWGI